MKPAFRHFKTMFNPSIVSVLSAQRCEAEKLHIRRSKLQRHRKVAVDFETLFELAKPNGYPAFHGRRFSMGAFLWCISHLWKYLKPYIQYSLITSNMKPCLSHVIGSLKREWPGRCHLVNRWHMLTRTWWTLSVLSSHSVNPLCLYWPQRWSQGSH